MPGRPPSRKLRAPVVPVALAPAPASAPNNDLDPVEEEEAPSLKKRKTTRNPLNKVKGRLGAMAVFNSLPLDLIYEICAQLDPQDLYHLSNTSKVFRSVVTGPSSEVLWVEARARVGLPELELKMTSLQYGWLLFAKGCSFCDRKNAGKADATFRARICTACIKTKFAARNTAAGNAAIWKATNQKLHPLVIYCCTPTSGTRGGPFFYLPELTRLNTEFIEKYGEGILDWENSNFIALRQHHHSTDDEAPVEPQNEFQRWYVSTDADRRARIEDGAKIQRWISDQENNKAQGKEGIRKQRYEELCRRFKLDGFDDIELKQRDFTENGNVRKVAAITDRTWGTASDQLKPVLLRIRRQLRKTKFESSYRQLKHAHADALSFPPDDILDHVPAVKALLDDLSTYAVPQVLWDSHKDEITSDLEAVVRQRRETLLRSIASAYAALKSAQEDGSAGKDVDCAIKNLKYSSITLPRLPPWIPRDANTPITATDEQLRGFFETNPLAAFECSKCHEPFIGTKHGIIDHVGHRRGCFSHTTPMSLTGMAVAVVNTSIHDWCRIDSSDRNMVVINRDTMFLHLYLSQCLDEALPDGVAEREANMTTRAEELEVDMEDNKKYQTILLCECTSSHRTLEVKSMYRHFRKNHWLDESTSAAFAPKLEAVAVYSETFKNAVRQAARLSGDMDNGAELYPYRMDYDSDEEEYYGHNIFDGYGGYEDSDDLMEAERRADCTVM